MATDRYPDKDGLILGTEGRLVKASGAIVAGDVCIFTAECETGELIPTVKKSDANDSNLFAGVAMQNIADGKTGKLATRPGDIVKVKITCSTIAIGVGDPLATDNGGGVKEAANVGNAQQIIGYSLNDSTTQNDEVLMKLAR